MNSIGFIVPNLGPNQLAYQAILVANKLSRADYDISFFFHERLQPCTDLLVASMHISEIHGYHGVLVSTNLETTKYSLNVINDIPRIFYINDIEWLRGNRLYFDYINVLHDKRLKLAVRSPSHKNMVENFCNKNARLFTKIDIPEMIKYGHEKDN